MQRAALFTSHHVQRKPLSMRERMTRVLDAVRNGGFVEFTNRSGSSQRWGVTTGVAASYENGEINREFLFLQGRYDNRKFSFVFGTQEVEVNRDWRETAEGESFSFTSTYLALRYRFGEDFSINGGLDNRRNVRLYRDIVTPETDFDDRYRRGFWAGFSRLIRTKGKKPHL